MTRSRPLLLLALAACAACSRNTDGPAAGLPVTMINLGLTTQPTELAGDGDLLLVAAREFEAGGRDLNGDGDAFDLVAFLVDLATGTTKNLALAVDPSAPGMLTAVRGGLVVLAASEASSGGRDLNGDGDAFDQVAFVLDRDGTLRGLGLALDPRFMPALGGNLAALAVSEAAQGADLDGDGLLASTVLHVYDARTRGVANTRLDAPSRLFVDGGNVAWFEDELDGDRTGDGDRLDAFVLQVFDMATRTSVDTGLATDGAAPQFAGGAWMFAVDERAQGADLDDDGEALDFIAHVLDVATGEVRNLGLACLDAPCALPVRVPGVREQLAFRVLRTGAPSDAPDLLDAVLYLYAPAARVLVRTGFSAALPPVLAGASVGTLVLEEVQGEDLDGDGVLSGAVAVATDLATGTSASLGLQAIDLRGSPELFLLARLESQAGEDWNQDGDLDDVVIHAQRPATGDVFNTRVASVDAFGASADDVLLYVDERAEGRDLNVDGDLSDLVFALFSLADDGTASLGLAGGLDAGRFGSLTAAGRLALLGDEQAEGRDLNGDGDLADRVLFRGE